MNRAKIDVEMKNNWHFAVEKKERDLKYKTDGCIKITYM